MGRARDREQLHLRHHRATAGSVLLLMALLPACDGPLSALAPAGVDAERIATLFWVMAIGAVVIWAAVMLSALYAVSSKRRPTERTANLFIIGGGVVAPVVVLTVLLIWGLSVLPKLLDTGPDEQPRVEVIGEQWWWRMRYHLDDGRTVELANELRLPVGRRSAVAVESIDVVHSLWVPAWAGKVDAIPGRTTYLGLEPTRASHVGGVCAEYCGLSHARMTFDAISMAPDAYQAWLEHQASDAQTPSGELEERGEQVFMSRGCGACHTVRGTDADGIAGPDLTHVGSRARIAGVLPNNRDAFRRWLLDPDAIKPGAHMPAFDALNDRDARALAAYLEALE